MRAPPDRPRIDRVRRSLRHARPRRRGIAAARVRVVDDTAAMRARVV
ncbi:MULTISPECIES: hypothetical protein [unclassified Halorubrum]|nr:MULTISPECIES: hypothetical protein [unclassified Halorubrum]